MTDYTKSIKAENEKRKESERKRKESLAKVRKDIGYGKPTKFK